MRSKQLHVEDTPTYCLIRSIHKLRDPPQGDHLLNSLEPTALLCLYNMIFFKEGKKQEIFTKCIITLRQRKITKFRKLLCIKEATCLLLLFVSCLQLSTSFSKKPVNQMSMIVIASGYCKYRTIPNNDREIVHSEHS